MSAAAAAAADIRFERDGGNPERDFAGLAAGSFVASVVGALVLIRAAMSIARLLRCGERRVGTGVAVVVDGGGGGDRRHLRDKLSPDQRMEIDALRSAAVRRRLRRCPTTTATAATPLLARGTDGSPSSSSSSTSTSSPPADGAPACGDAEAPPPPSEIDGGAPPSSAMASIGGDGDDGDDDDEPCCAICHERYAPSDLIVRSSDPARCRHAFHEECMVRWLVSSGWTKSRIVVPIKALLLLRSSGGGGGGGGGGGDVDGANAEEDDDGDLLDYDLECPCCRQVFVDRTSSSSSSSSSSSPV